MADPWLTIIGLNEDGLSGLAPASRVALGAAEIIIGGPRHLTLVDAASRGQPWPVPFSTAPVLAARGRKTVVLASGDPFWFGAGGALVAALTPDEWISHPALSTFQLAANALGWRLEMTPCHGLHAAPFSRLLPDLHPGARILATLRDGDAPAQLAQWLADHGFGLSTLTILERLGGPHQRLRKAPAAGFDLADIRAPVAIALQVAGIKGLPRSPGLPNHLFQSDGQMTKSPIRALTLAALAPRPHELLWDLGAGTGTISLEWCLAGAGMVAETGPRALAVEQRPDRAANIRANAQALGVDQRLTVVESSNLAALAQLPPPDAVFIGGGAEQSLLAALWSLLSPGTRIVANSVTLETDALLAHWHQQNGGELSRFDIARATPLGPARGWTSLRPVTQWSVLR